MRQGEAHDIPANKKPERPGDGRSRHPAPPVLVRLISGTRGTYPVTVFFHITEGARAQRGIPGEMSCSRDT